MHSVLWSSVEVDILLNARAAGARFIFLPPSRELIPKSVNSSLESKPNFKNEWEVAVSNHGFHYSVTLRCEPIGVEIGVFTACEKLTEKQNILVSKIRVAKHDK